MTTSSSEPIVGANSRQYYIDWIRVIAFCILIFYHTGMFFVSWEWHVKNTELLPSFEWWMRWFGQWRLSLLFFISGVGVSFALRSRTAGAFAGERTKRLLLPLVFGMFVIVPPQIYFEWVQQKHYTGGYFDFYPSVLEFVAYPKGSFSWHHLWFIAYLWVYSLLGLPIFLWLRSESGKKALVIFYQIFNRPVALLSLFIPLLIIYWLLVLRWDVTHNLIADWYNLSFSFVVFLYGYLLGSSPAVWNLLETQRKKYLYLAITLTAIMYVVFWIPDIVDDEPNAIFYAYGFVKILNIWTIILTICGFAKHYLNFSTPFLRYANQAVYPFYILHQTVEVAFGFWIATSQLSPYLKFFLLAFLTFGGSWAIYHFLIRPFKWIRPLFGVKG